MIEDIISQYLSPAFVSVIVTILIAYLITRRQLYHPALEYVQDQYRKPEMLDALRQLWKLYDEVVKDSGLTKSETGKPLSKIEENKIEEKIRKKYREIYKAEEKMIEILFKTTNKLKKTSTMNDQNEFAIFMKNRDNAACCIFDNKRRLVSHFFSHLDTLLENRILTVRQIQRTFPSAAETLKKINIPLEQELVDIICDKRPWISDSEREKRKKLSINKLEHIVSICEGKTMLDASVVINGHPIISKHSEKKND
jgi:hypothetical protein